MKNTEQVDEESIQEEVQRLMDVLRTLVRMLGYTNRDIERRAGLNHATTVKNFKGDGEPKLEFILKVVRAVGLEFWEFFELAYAEPAAASSAGERLRRMLERLQPRPPRVVGPPEKAPEPKREERQEVAALPRQDIEKMLESLRSEVRELFEAKEKASKAVAPSPAAEPSGLERENGEG